MREDSKVFVAESKVQSRTFSEDISKLAVEAKTDPVAFGQLYDHYVQLVYRYICSRVGSVFEAEDITSQTFMAVYESLPRYRERGYFSAWLFRIARSKINEHYRRSKREVEIEAAREILDREDALGILIQAEELNRIRFLISNLKNKEQELICLRYVAGLSFAEIADLVGKREDAVKKSIYRLLARLKCQME